MKRNFIYMLLCLVGLLTTSATCSNDDDGEKNINSSLIIGKWKAVSGTFNGTPMDDEDLGKDAILEFKTDGTWTSGANLANKEDYGSGTWSIDGDILLYKSDDSETDQGSEASDILNGFGVDTKNVKFKILTLTSTELKISTNVLGEIVVDYQRVK
jgi:hypothetical protein